MEIWAHRGASSIAKENTLEAFQEALNHNISGVELDVQIDYNGTPIVLHDRTILGVEVRYATADELSDVLGYHVPTLDEALEVLAGKTKINLDLKTDLLTDGELERKCTRLVRQYKCSHQTIFSSTSSASLMKVRLFHPSANVALIVEKQWEMLKAKLIHVPVHIHGALATAKNIKSWRDRGFKIRVWTVNNSNYAKYLKKMGVSGIFTDRPQDY